MIQSEIKELHKEFLQSTGICTDTRKDVEGSLFFGLKGENFDGNRFVEEALSKGCRLAVTERKELDGEHSVVYMPDALKGLQDLAHQHRIHVSPRVLSITGSNGKTTTKELVSAVLSRKYSVLATRGNLNNHIGVPLTLLSLQKEQVAVVELGANHPGEIGKLAAIAAPSLGLITNVGKAHLEGFGSIEGVLEAKGELYDYLAANGGEAIVDGRDQVLMKKAERSGVHRLVVGEDGDLRVSARILEQAPYLVVELTLDGTIHHLSTHMVGAYNLQNMILAAGAGLYFNIPATSVVEAIAGFVPENQRSQLIRGGGNHVILDSYNANPSSMREAISGLLSYGSSPTMLILGDMAELGATSPEEHRELVRWIGTLNVDRVLLVGSIFCQVCEPSSRMNVFKLRQELERYLEDEKPSGFHILVKGSRVCELEKILGFLVD